MLFASANCANRKVRRDSRIAAQGVQPLVRNGVTQNSPDFNRLGCSPRRAHIQGLPLYRSAPFVPKGLFYVNRSVYLFSLNHFNAFICWVELKRILDCHKRSGIIPAICHSFFHCCHCRISGSHQIPVISLPTLPDRCSFRNFGLNLFYEHPSKWNGLRCSHAYLSHLLYKNILSESMDCLFQHAAYSFLMVAGTGLEPISSGAEPNVLPLHHPAKRRPHRRAAGFTPIL